MMSGLRWGTPAWAGLVIALAGCSQPTPEESMARGQAALEKQDYAHALVELKTAAAARPESAQTRFLLGKVLLATNDPQGAELELRKALDLKHPASAVQPELARALLVGGKAQRVVEEFASVSLQDAAASADLKTSVAIAHARLGNRKAGAAALEEALRLKPDDPTALLAKARQRGSEGDIDGALKIVEGVLAAHPKSAEAWQNQGDLLLHGKRDLAAAYEAYGKAVAAVPAYLPALQQRVRVNLMRGDPTAARKDFEVLRRAAPSLLQTLFFEAQFAFLDKDFQKAQSLTQSLLKSHPNSVAVMALDASTRLQLNAPLLAEASAAKAVSQAPDALLPRKLLAQAHLQMGRHAAALADLRSLLDQPQPESDVLALAAEAHLQAGDLEKADELFTRAVKANPEDASVRTSAAMVRLARGDADKAFAELEALAAKDASDVADLALISARMRRKEWDAALKAATALEAKAPGKAAGANLAGQVHLLRGARAEARASFERALSVNPLYLPAAVSLARLDVQDKKPEAARQRFDAMLKANPKDVQARMALIELRASEKAPATEIASGLAEIVRTEPGALAPRLALVDHYLTHKEPKKALEVAQETSNFFRFDPNALDALGRAQFATGDLQQALTTYATLATQLPKSAGPLLRQADIRAMQGSPDAAALLLARAQELAPDDPEIYKRLIATAMFGKQYDKALGHARAFQKRQPNAAMGYELEAEIEGRRQNWAAAATVLRAGLQKAPQQGGRMAQKLYASYALGGRQAEADGVATAWMKDHPADIDFVVRTGEFWLLRSSPARAEAFFREAVKLDPKNASVLNNLAWALVQQKNPGALEIAQQAVALDGRSLSIQDTLGTALAQADRKDEAIAVFTRLVEQAPEKADYKLSLARLYVQSKQPDKARPLLDDLARLKDKFGGSEEVQRLRAAVK